MNAIRHPQITRVTVRSFASRDEWLSERAQSDTIGASEAAMALGVSPYGTAWSLWESKHAPLAGKRSSVLTRGNRWESAVLAEYEDEARVRVLTPAEACGEPAGSTVLLAHPTASWLRQSPDAFAIDRSGELGQVEAKTAMHAHAWSPEAGVVIEHWDDAHAELVPPHYAIHGYVQLAVSGLPWVDLCALVPRGGWLGVRWVRLQRDLDTQAGIVDALAAWRERHLVRGEAPALDGSEPCNRYLAKRFPVGKVKPERTASEAEAALMLRLAELRACAKAASEEADLTRNALLESAEGHRLLLGDDKAAPYGQPQVNTGRTLVDLDALRAEAPELVAKHTRLGNPSASFNLYRFAKQGDPNDRRNVG